MKCPRCGSENVICFPKSMEHIAYCQCNNCKKTFLFTKEVEKDIKQKDRN